jgi:hypothetical protein
MKILCWIFGVLLALAIVAAVSFWAVFGTQMKAVNSIKLVTDGMYMFTYEGENGVDELLSRGGASNPQQLAAFATEYMSHGLMKVNYGQPDFGCCVCSA